MAAAPGAAQPLTARRLKALSGEFDLGNIVTLRAPAASALGDLGRCIHLQQLDLSQTSAAVLAPSAVLPPVPAAPADPAAGATVAEHPFAALQQLESLRLDRCGLVSLDFVPPLPKLTHLSVVGNALATVEALAPLIDERRFPALARIDIQTIDGILSNPVCETPAYREWKGALPERVAVVDGQRRKSKAAADFYGGCSAAQSQLNKLEAQRDSLAEENRIPSPSGPWFDESELQIRMPASVKDDEQLARLAADFAAEAKQARALDDRAAFLTDEQGA